MIVLNETFATVHTVRGLTCSNIDCPNILGYEGTEHGVTPSLFSKGKYLSIRNIFLIKMIESIYYRSSTLTEFWNRTVTLHEVAMAAEISLTTNSINIETNMNILAQLVECESRIRTT